MAAIQKLTQASTALALSVQRSAAVMSGASPGQLRKLLPCCLGGRRGQSSSSSSLPPSSSSGGGGDSNGRRKVVSVSTILSQDGLDFQELPILVRLLDRNSGVVPLVSHTYPGEQVRPMSLEDQNFQLLLQQCTSVKDVFMLLEIPSERVTGYSAFAALQRVCQLQKLSADWDDLHSFIRTAVMKELCDTVRRDVGLVSKETLVSLVSCYLDMDSFGPECVSAVNEEIEKRMVEELFSVEELCEISTLLHASERGDKDLINSIWVFIANHYQDVEEHSIAIVLDALPASHRYLLKVLGKQVHKLWWKMSEEDVVSCLRALVDHNSLQVTMLTSFSRWLFLNIHLAQEASIMQFVATFIHFRFSDARFVTAMERYVGTKGDEMGTSLLGLIAEYCRVRRYFSPTILDTAARHFVRHGENYSALEMFTVLRPFGQLNYLPKDCHQFLLQTESMLEQKFDNFQPSHLAELLCSFAFVEKIPLNFVVRVLTPTFLSRVKGGSEEAGMWLEMLQSAVKLETRGVRVPYLYKKQRGAAWRGERLWMLQNKLEDTLNRMFGSSASRARTFAPNTIYTIDAEMHLNEEGMPVPVSYQSSAQASTRLAMVLMAGDHYCVNSGHLLGEYAMRLRHLRKLGYTVIEVFDAEFLPMNNSQREHYLTQKLRRWVHEDAFINGDHQP